MREVSRALRALRTRAPNVALGPAPDGGYFLVGLRGPLDDLFRDIAWSTPGVLSQTRTRAVTLGLAVHLIEPWCDVDDAETLERASRVCDTSQIAEWWRTRRVRAG